MTARCAVSELPLGQCGAPCCNQPAPRPAAIAPTPAARPTPPRPRLFQDLVDARTSDRPGWMPAKTRGQCAACTSLFVAGTLIRAHEATGGWVAECCDPEAPAFDAIPGGEGPDGQDLWARLVAKAAGMGEAA